MLPSNYIGLQQAFDEWMNEGDSPSNADCVWHQGVDIHLLEHLAAFIWERAGGKILEVDMKVADTGAIQSVEIVEEPKPQLTDEQLEEIVDAVFKDVFSDILMFDNIELRRDMFRGVRMKNITEQTYGDLMPVEEFDECCECGAFNSDDGSGYWVHNGYESSLSVFRYKRPSWATHVMWYNK